MTEHRRQFRQPFQSCLRPWPFVFIHNNYLFTLFNFHRENFIIKFTLIHRADSVHLGIERPFILLLSGKAELIGHF